MRKFVVGQEAPDGVNGEVAWFADPLNPPHGQLRLFVAGFGWSESPLVSVYGPYDECVAQWTAFRTAVYAGVTSQMWPNG